MPSGAWNLSSVGTGLPGHAAVCSTVAGPVPLGRGTGDLSLGASSSGFLPTQQLLIWVRGWEMLSAVSPALGGASSLPLTAIKCSWTQDPCPTPGLQEPQVSGRPFGCYPDA